MVYFDLGFFLLNAFEHFFMHASDTTPNRALEL